MGAYCLLPVSSADLSRLHGKFGRKWGKGKDNGRSRSMPCLVWGMPKRAELSVCTGEQRLLLEKRPIEKRKLPLEVGKKLRR